MYICVQYYVEEKNCNYNVGLKLLGLFTYDSAYVKILLRCYS